MYLLKMSDGQTFTQNAKAIQASHGKKKFVNSFCSPVFFKN